MKEEGIKADGIEKIVVRTFRYAVDGHQEISPDTIVGATMSYPYCIAVLLMTGKVAITEFTEKKLKDQKFMDRVREVGKKCEFIIDPELEKLYPEQYPAVTKVIMRDGRVFERSVDAPRGFYPEHPVSDDQVKEKFRGLAMQVISKDKAEKVIRLIDNLEKVKNVGEIVKLLAP